MGAIVAWVLGLGLAQAYDCYEGRFFEQGNFDDWYYDYYERGPCDPGSALAGGPGEGGDGEIYPWEETATRPELRRASGTVVRTKAVSIDGTTRHHRVVLLRTARGNDRLVVDLGGEAAEEKARQGATLVVEGRVVWLGHRMLLVAADAALPPEPSATAEPAREDAALEALGAFGARVAD